MGLGPQHSADLRELVFVPPVVAVRPAPVAFACAFCILLKVVKGLGGWWNSSRMGYPPDQDFHGNYRDVQCESIPSFPFVHKALLRTVLAYTVLKYLLLAEEKPADFDRHI